MAKGTLSMSNATYGRDTAGKAKLKADLLADIDAAIKVLNGKEYQAVIDTVKANWAGVDADKFLSSFKNDVSEMKSKFGQFKKKIENLLNTDTKNFAKQQASIASKITDIKF